MCAKNAFLGPDFDRQTLFSVVVPEDHRYSGFIFKVTFKKSNFDLTITKLAPKLGLAAMHKIIKRVGREKIRVSEKAADQLRRILEYIGSEIAREAIDFALHAGRKTVKARDVEIAYPKIMAVIAEKTRK